MNLCSSQVQAARWSKDDVSNLGVEGEHLHLYSWLKPGDPGQHLRHHLQTIPSCYPLGRVLCAVALAGVVTWHVSLSSDT